MPSQAEQFDVGYEGIDADTVYIQRSEAQVDIAAAFVRTCKIRLVMGQNRASNICLKESIEGLNACYVGTNTPA
ncbi:hypothetical protein VMCG_08537 [Cytospora schulzeri]|uniref:Uncharacterized protein n=1 Tax=Cytospora schulzeri TaxID=448051 RepID=A0A423VVQ3_9PEZI|nr:hypothetical protein VMCG_08537 [Valsa malicola]